MMDDLEKLFRPNLINEEQKLRCDLIIDKAMELAFFIDKACEDSRRKTLALTSVESAFMWAIKSIAMEENDP